MQNKKKDLKGRNLPSLVYQFINWKAVTASKNTLLAYEGSLENYLNYCYERELDPLAAQTVNSWVAHLRVSSKIKRRKGCTINNYVGRLSAFFEWGVNMDYFIKNPTKLTPKLPPELSHVRGFTEDEVKKLLVSAGKDETRMYWPPMILLGHHYGMRIQDCAEFSATCVDWNRNKFTFIPQKQARKEIELPLHADVALALSGLTPGERYYFPLAVKRYLSNSVTPEFKALVNDAGLDSKLTFHCLRHGAATNMIKAGINLTTIVEIIGWTSTAMLQRYLDRDEGEIAKLTMNGSVISPLPQCSTP
jgi:integrase